MCAILKMLSLMPSHTHPRWRTSGGLSWISCHRGVSQGRTLESAYCAKNVEREAGYSFLYCLWSSPSLPSSSQASFTNLWGIGC